MSTSQLSALESKGATPLMWMAKWYGKGVDGAGDFGPDLQELSPEDSVVQ